MHDVRVERCTCVSGGVSDHITPIPSIPLVLVFVDAGGMPGTAADISESNNARRGSRCVIWRDTGIQTPKPDYRFVGESRILVPRRKTSVDELCELHA